MYRNRMTEVASCTRASEAKFAECIGQELCHWRHPGLLADVVYYNMDLYGNARLV